MVPMFQLTLFLIFAYVVLAKNHTLSIGLVKRCPAAFLDVGQFDNLYIDSLPVDNEEFRMNRRHEECSVSVMTGLVEHGLCLSFLEMALSCDVDVFLKTNAYEPDKKIDCRHARPSEWCTTEPLTTITVKARHTQRSDLNGPSFKFLIKIQAVPLQHIRNMYYLDSKLECGIQHQLKEGESVRVFSHRRPRVSKELPAVCDVTFFTTGIREYEQVCFKFDKFIDDCDIDLLATNLLTPHWAPNETFNCMSEESKKEEEFCSSDKQLNMRLTRKSHTKSDFAITVESKRHSYWEYEEQVKSEFVGLHIVRSLIFVVSVINAIIALSVAVITFLHRNPLSSIRQWNIHSIFYLPNRENNGAILTSPNDHVPNAFPAEKNQCEQPVI